MAFDDTLAMSQSDTSVSRIDPFSSSLATTGRHSSTALSLNPTSLTIASLVSPTSPSVDPFPGAIVTQSFPALATESNGTVFAPDTELGNPTLNIDVDPQILEALRNKDRIYVLKLGESFEALIKDRRIRVEVSHSTSYQRLLIHRCSAYYKLQPESDPLTKALYVMLTSESRIPERRICELVPAESPTQPAFQIMKREPRSKSHSHTSSVAGDEADLSDVEPSESGSLSGQSYSGSRKRMTIEQREAAYNEARSRIFMGFEEKGKEMSASSSTMSVNGSTSSAGRGYMGDTDDAVGLPPTEGEWSMPTNTYPKRRGIPASASSSRGLRSGGSFHGNSSGNSSRNSRAASPSFSYPSLYEATPQGQLYDAPHLAANPAYHSAQYGYPYPPNQAPNPSYLSPYPYYTPHYAFQSPSMSQHHPPDPPLPPGPESFPQHHQMGYMPSYGWPPQPLANQPPMQPHPHSMHPPIPPHHQNPMNQIGPMSLPPPHAPPYQPYMHPPHAYPYSVNSVNPYYPTGPPGQQPVGPPPPQIALQPQPHPGYDPRAMNLNTVMRPPLENFNSNPQYSNNMNYNNAGGFVHGGPRSALGNGIIQPNARPMSHRSSSSSSGNSNSNSSKRGVAPSASRPMWNSGPGIPMGGFPHHVGGGMNESVGPRFNSLNRRTSGNTSSGGNSCASSTTNGDDVSSIASSSTTSSSSRRTYTSTTSSQQHPLPPRPDWAVGLKAQPTLAGRHHDQSLNNSRNMSPTSPSKSNGQNSPHSDSNSSNNHSPRNPQLSQQPLVPLQATDFPPLTTSAPAQEKRVPLATGAWGASRPVLPPNLNGNLNTPQSLRGEETGNDHRITCKSGENYTPKLARRPVHSPGIIASNITQAPRVPQFKTDSTTSLAGQVALMTLGEEQVASGDAPLPVINTNPPATTSLSPNAVSAVP